MGVANKKYCLGLCKSIKRSRGQCYLYVSKRTHEKQVVKLADENDLLVECDVASDASIQAAFETIKNEVGTIDGLVHAIAFAKKKNCLEMLVTSLVMVSY